MGLTGKKEIWPKKKITGRKEKSHTTTEKHIYEKFFYKLDENWKTRYFSINVDHLLNQTEMEWLKKATEPVSVLVWIPPWCLFIRCCHFSIQTKIICLNFRHSKYKRLMFLEHMSTRFSVNVSSWLILNCYVYCFLNRKYWFIC